MNPDDLTRLVEAQARARDEIIEMLSDLAFATTSAPMPMDYFDRFALLLDVYERAIGERVRAEALQER